MRPPDDELSKIYFRISKKDAAGGKRGYTCVYYKDEFPLVAHQTTPSLLYVHARADAQGRTVIQTVKTTSSSSKSDNPDTS